MSRSSRSFFVVVLTFSTSVFLFFGLITLLGLRVAHADENHVEQVPQRPKETDARMRIGGFYETSIGVRSLNLRGLTLRAAGTTSEERARGIGTSMVVQGGNVSPAMLGTLGIGGGLALGPIVGGVEIGVGVGGGARGPVRSAGDIDVRPSGFAAAMNTSTFLGFMVETKHARYRLDGVLGWELAGIGMERPGFPDTRVSAVNADRWTLGPRVRVDFLVTDACSVGVGLGMDARHPFNTSLTLVMSVF